MTIIDDTAAPPAQAANGTNPSRTDGGRWLFVPTGAERVVIDALLANHARQPPAGQRDVGARLTARENEVLALVTEGLSNKEIARRLHLSPSTVKCHVHNLLTKTGLLRRSQLCAWRAAAHANPVS